MSTGDITPNNTSLTHGILLTPAEITRNSEALILLHRHPISYAHKRLTYLRETLTPEMFSLDIECQLLERLLEVAQIQYAALSFIYNLKVFRWMPRYITRPIVQAVKAYNPTYLFRED